MNPRSAGEAQGLWAITSYFNPVGYRHRLANYRIFREYLKVPLVTVELAYGPDFELGEGDADILVQLRGTDVMWQKERLLNIALKALPDGCSKVAWLDCDIVFEKDEWADHLSAKLDTFMIVQPFDQAHHLLRDRAPDEITERDVGLSQTSIVCAINSGRPLRSVLSQLVDRTRGTFAGFAWSARREVLDSHAFYDACIIGGGDTAFVFAACGLAEDVARLHSMNDRQKDRYLEWASRFHAAASGSVSHIPGDLFHLWHGQIADRRARERHERLSLFGFDPYADITINENGPWQWASSKPELHAYLKAYFAGRKEDG